MRPHAELHQQLYSGNGHWKLKVRHSFQLTGTQKPFKICAELCPSLSLCGQETSPWSAATSVPALIECHVDTVFIFWHYMPELPRVSGEGRKEIHSSLAAN